MSNTISERIIPDIPPDWPYSHIPTWEYDEDGDIEVSNYACGECEYHGNKCKCIDHAYLHFARPYFSCDRLTSHHSICKSFKCDPLKYPAGCLEWDALGSFDKWYKIWIKQWHYNRNPPWPKIGLNRANQIEGREHSDNVYYVSYKDFLNCNIMKNEGIHCLDYIHIERTREKKYPTGYKWVHEGSGIWIPWENNRYDT